MKPMLAAATDGTNLRYPMLVSPKLDGVRCLIINSVAMSRSLKPIPNDHVQRLFGRREFNGFDGELIVGDDTTPNVFQKTTSGVMTIKGQPEVTFHIFDDHLSNLSFQSRLSLVERRVRGMVNCSTVPHDRICNEVQLNLVEDEYLLVGYEGVMIRDPVGPYKYGRSTLKEGYLLKLKRFVDSEAKIIGFEPLELNVNPAVRNELGHLERSSKKSGKVIATQLGAFRVKDIKTGVEFELGTGYTSEQRHKFWRERVELLGCLVKYKSQTVGVKDKPRFPVFLGFRDWGDL